MSKTKKHVKLERQVYEDARKMTPGKLLRLALKSLLFALLVAFIVVGLNLLGVPAFNNPWIQLGIMIVVYVIAYPFLMSEFRPKANKK